MATKYRRILLLSLLIIAVVWHVTGCANIINVRVNVFYYSPQWSSDGNILCIKNRRASVGGSGGMGGASGSSVCEYYITSLNPDDLSEKDKAFIGEDLLSIGDVSASPLGNYYAYKTYKKLNIIKSNGESLLSVDINDESASFDWAPDESKLVLLENGTLNIVERTSGNITAISTIEAHEPSWRYGDKIVFYGGKNDVYHLSFIRPDGTGLEMTALTHEATGAYPQYSVDGSKIYTIWTNYIKRIDVGTKLVDYTINASNESFARKVSPDGTKLLGEDNNIWNYYLFTINLDGSNRRNIATW